MDGSSFSSGLLQSVLTREAAAKAPWKRMVRLLRKLAQQMSGSEWCVS